MRHIETKVNSYETADNRHFDIVVTKTFIDQFGKEYNEKRIWDTVLHKDLIKEFDSAIFYNPIFKEVSNA